MRRRRYLRNEMCVDGERLVNILKICYERDTFHGARQPKVKKLNNSNKNK